MPFAAAGALNKSVPVFVYNILCAREGGTCRQCFSVVRYGIGGRYSYRKSNGTLGCNNGVFGDPYVNRRKECYCRSSSTQQFTYPVLPALATVSATGVNLSPLHSLVSEKTFQPKLASGVTTYVLVAWFSFCVCVCLQVHLLCAGRV